MRGRAKKLDLVPVSYYIKDPLFGEIEIQNTVNAWWLNSAKVENLIVGLKMGLKPEEACAYTGITRKQYDYFLERHPNFCEILPLLRLHPKIIAKETVYKKLHKNASLAFDYLKHTSSDEFNTKSTVLNEQITPKDIIKELEGEKDIFDKEGS